MKNKSAGRRTQRGRPQKYIEPSRRVTVTLPESTLEYLRQLDSDRDRAIVMLTNEETRRSATLRRVVQIIEVARGVGLLIVPPGVIWSCIPFLHLVEIAPAQHVLALELGFDLHALEVALLDAIDDLPEERFRDKEMVGQLLAHLRLARKSARITIGGVVMVQLDEEHQHESRRKSTRLSARRP